jgi:uncharacterized repeat protein (TIGR01451 family)
MPSFKLQSRKLSSRKGSSIRFLSRISAIAIAFSFAGVSYAQLAPNTRVVTSPTACPTGTTETGANLFPNGNFSNTADTLDSSVPQGPFNTYPPDTRTSIQSGDRNYVGGVVAQRQFPGDVSRGVPASPTWLYANGNTTGGPYRTMRKTVTGLVPGYTYTFFAYVSNAIAPSRTAPDDPIMRFVRNPGSGDITLANFTVPDDQNTPGGNSTTDTWTLVQTTFVAGASSEVFSLFDAATGANGDDFAMTQINIRQCVPPIRLTKSFTPTTIPAGGTATLTFRLDNTATSPIPAVNLTGNAFTDTLPLAILATANGTLGSGCTGGTATRNAAGTVVSASNVGIAAGAVCTISFPVTSVTASTCPGAARHTNGPGNLSNLNSTVTNNVTDQCLAVNASADLSITKTNTPAAGPNDQAADTVNAGTLVAYDLVVANAGPSPANGALLRDTPTSGLTCSTVVCCDGTAATCGAGVGTPTGGASCPAAANVTIPNLTGTSGIALNLPAPASSLTFRVGCNVP